MLPGGQAGRVQSGNVAFRFRNRGGDADVRRRLRWQLVQSVRENEVSGDSHLVRTGADRQLPELSFSVVNDQRNSGTIDNVVLVPNPVPGGGDRPGKTAWTINVSAQLNFDFRDRSGNRDWPQFLNLPEFQANDIQRQIDGGLLRGLKVRCIRSERRTERLGIQSS